MGEHVFKSKKEVIGKLLKLKIKNWQWGCCMLASVGKIMAIIYMGNVLAQVPIWTIALIVTKFTWITTIHPGVVSLLGILAA